MTFAVECLLVPDQILKEKQKIQLKNKFYYFIVDILFRVFYQTNRSKKKQKESVNECRIRFVKAATFYKTLTDLI